MAPTLRATTWSPLLGCVCALAALAVVRGLLDAGRPDLPGIAGAALAAAVVGGLHDRAADLLAAVPVSEVRRRARRLVLLVPAAAGAWGAYVAGEHLHSEPGWPLGQPAALLACGLAVTAWVPGRVGVSAGAAVPLCWAFTAVATPGGAVGDALFAWQSHPWPTCLVATTVGLLGVARSTRDPRRTR
ncbi:hypothetical protein GCM10022263_00670 [Nocardioides daeguensis]|uniref:Uncharacterized protein n=2 Tax=Nocardioides daeguensis TaxID=908359 RepID=A0ABP6USM3_9ACTN